MTDPMVKPEEAGLMRYLKEAFTFRWNLLLLVGGVAAAAISPAPDVLLPLLGAAELAYLAGLTTIPRFRAAIDAKAHAEKTGGGTVSTPQQAQPKLAEMVRGLAPDARQRFQVLRSRCLDMRHIAHGVRGRSGGNADDHRTPGLDRLLWVFLRLLYSQQALQRFLDSTDEAQIQKRLAKLDGQKKSAEERKDERILRSLVDSIATTQLRLDNYAKAQQNAEFVAVEIDRIEGKIQALTEMGVSHQDPDYITAQVDSVADSMAQTEAAMRELEQITGITDDLEGTPAILESNLEQVEA